MKAEVSFDVFSGDRANDKADGSIKKQEWVFRLEDALAFG